MTDATSWHWQIFAEFREKHQHVCGTTSFHSFEGCVFHLSPSMSLPVQFSTTHRCHCHHYNATAGAQPGVFESPAHESAAHLWGIELRWNRCGTRTTGWNHWNDVSCLVLLKIWFAHDHTRRSWNAWKSASRWAPDGSGLGANDVNLRQRSRAFRYWVFPVLALDRYEKLPFCNGICFPLTFQFSHSISLEMTWMYREHLQYLAEHSLTPHLLVDRPQRPSLNPLQRRGSRWNMERLEHFLENRETHAFKLHTSFCSRSMNMIQLFTKY